MFISLRHHAQPTYVAEIKIPQTFLIIQEEKAGLIQAYLNIRSQKKYHFIFLSLVTARK